MANKTKATKAANNAVISAMPSTMISEGIERRTREEIEEVTKELNESVGKIRNEGVEINTVEDLQRFTPSFIAEGIREQKKKQLSGQFIPIATRKRIEGDFSNMQKVIMPMAESLQNIIKRYQLGLKVDAEGYFYFDPGKVEEYIKNKSSVTIPDTMRELYNYLELFCKQWQKLQSWCKQNGIEPLNVSLMETLTSASSYASADENIKILSECTLNITPDAFFNLLMWGKIRKKI